MSYKTRVIARLDIKGPNLVKGIHLEGLRVLGKPEKFAKYYFDHGADELFYQDINIHRLYLEFTYTSFPIDIHFMPSSIIQLYQFPLTFTVSAIHS